MTTERKTIRPNVFIHNKSVVGPNGLTLIENSPPTPAKLGELVLWLGERKNLKNPTLWLLGDDIAGRFGWLEQRENKEATAELIRASLKKAFSASHVDTAAVERAAYRFTVYPHWNARGERDRVIAEIVVARLGELTEGHRGVLDDLQSDDSSAAEAEIVHRVRWIADNLKIDAAGPAAKLGQRLAERIWNPAPPAGVWPLGNDVVPTKFEPSFHGPIPEPGPGEKIVVVDQRKAVFAEMGNVRLGIGKPRKIPAHQVDWLSANTAPCAIVQVELPALDELGIRPIMRVHPNQQLDRGAQVWVCTATIRQMCAGTADGGLGVDLDDIRFLGDAWVWDKTSQKLEAWTKALRAGFTAAGDDKSLTVMLQRIYQRLYMRFSLQQGEADTSVDQPVWSGLIRAGVRVRSLKYLARIAADTQLWPVSAQVDAWYYVVPEDFDETVFNDNSEFNGKYRVKEVTHYDPDAHSPEQQAAVDLQPGALPQTSAAAIASPLQEPATPHSPARPGGILTKLFGGRSR
ncbi:hypothetical protein [Mycobacteroides abscessus]|uniref:hypothetical protein n=1 Tax=Mycobacteroides abscessus TaxID=36809 RepID=UPI000C257CB6|nr:hypothetical protein [Mycobacteroides abscessus]